jgi:hypothetical protein
MKRFGKFLSGPAVVFNPVPINHEECVQHGNALADSGHYPVGTDDCFNVGISGGCGPVCFVYLEGRCGEPAEMLPRLTGDELKRHAELYPPNPLLDRQEESR